MKTGLFFGSFNPIHIGHLVIAGYMSQFTDLQEVWLVVSPHNPLKPQDALADENHRLAMARLAVGENPKVKVSDAEFSLPRPSYTLHTLRHFQKQFPDREFVVIVGEDSLENFHQWKDYQTILDDFQLYVYNRPMAVKTILHGHTHVNIVHAPLMEISSTFIRKNLLEKKDVRYMLPDAVWKYIETHKPYR